MAANAETETMAKARRREHVERRLRVLKANWREISRPRCTGACRRPRRCSNGSTRRRRRPMPAAIGISRDKHARDHARARLIRRRFTGLDVLHDLGWLGTAVFELFAPGGFWFNDGRKA